MLNPNILARAQQILAQALQEPTKPVMEEPSLSSNIIIDPASPTAREVYWEQADGRIVGGVKPEFLATIGTGKTATFWIITDYEGQARWVRSDRLRSRKAFEQQVDVRQVELIRTF
ncbi:MAG: hypothetical protein ABI980_15235 [Nitrospirota bacterium]